jgi:ABC-type branched-subunit amino acid transport system substrate-binding protein
MIYPRNHLQRLNGNSWLVLAACISLLLSCSRKPITVILSKPEPSQMQDTIPAYGKMDTIQWTKIEPEITKDTLKSPKDLTEDQLKEKLLKKDTIRVALLVPMYSKSDPESNENLLKMHHFALGAKMATKETRNTNTKFYFTLYDIESNKNKLEDLLRKDSLINYDIIVGPYKTDDIKKVIEYAKKNDQWVISPWNTSSNFLQLYRQYIQIKPGLEAHLEAISQDIATHFPSSKPYVVCGKNDKREQGYFQRIKQSAAIQENKLLGHRLQLLIADGHTGYLDTLILKNAYDSIMHNIYILPYWSDHQFVLKFFQAMGPYIAEQSNVTIYGLPQWLNFQELSLDLYERFNVRISAHAFYGVNEPDSRQFRRRFFQTYQTVPLEDAYHAYDLTQWIIQTFDNKKLSAASLIGKNTFNQLFPVNLQHAPSEFGSSDSNPGFENKATYILKFDGGRFSRVESMEKPY